MEGTMKEGNMERSKQLREVTMMEDH